MSPKASKKNLADYWSIPYVRPRAESTYIQIDYIQQQLTHRFFYLLGASFLGVLGARESNQWDSVSLAGTTLDERALVSGRRQTHVWLAVDVQPVSFQRQPDVTPLHHPASGAVRHRSLDSLQQWSLPVQTDGGRRESSDDRSRCLARRSCARCDWLGQDVGGTPVSAEWRWVEVQWRLVAGQSLDDELVRDARLQVRDGWCIAVRGHCLVTNHLLMTSLLHLHHRNTGTQKITCHQCVEWPSSQRYSSFLAFKRCIEQVNFDCVGLILR